MICVNQQLLCSEHCDDSRDRHSDIVEDIIGM